MSWHFLQGQAEASWEANSLDGAPSALLSLIPIADRCCLPGNEMDSFRDSQSGMTSEPLMRGLGGGEWMSFQAASPVSHSAPRPEDGVPPQTFGPRCDESSLSPNRVSSSPRMSAERPLNALRTTSLQWVTPSAPLPLERNTWVQTMSETAIGFLHTPTTKANYCARSMQKWPSARAFTAVFGRPSPSIHEWMMGWPHGWTDIAPLEMDKFRAWQRQHGEC